MYPQKLVERVEATQRIPEGSMERFDGYGVMGLPFKSGHVLALRRFPASSLGPGYSSVWHRNPEGEWVFYTNISPKLSCPRFFGSSLKKAVETKIKIGWLHPLRMHVSMPAQSFNWEVEVRETGPTRLMNRMGSMLPGWAWRSPSILKLMSKMAGAMLGVGRIAMYGNTSNGQKFLANPRTIYAVRSSHAQMGAEIFGAPAPLETQARLGDFWIPQRGILAIGQSYFDTFNPSVHLVMTSQAATGLD